MNELILVGVIVLILGGVIGLLLNGSRWPPDVPWQDAREEARELHEAAKAAKKTEDEIQIDQHIVDVIRDGLNEQMRADLNGGSAPGPASEAKAKSAVTKCKVCGRPLREHRSVKAGFGPVCKRRYEAETITPTDT